VEFSMPVSVLAEGLRCNAGGDEVANLVGLSTFGNTRLDLYAFEVHKHLPISGFFPRLQKSSCCRNGAKGDA